MNGARSVPIASTGKLPSVPHLLPIGFGTMGQRRSWRQASDSGRPHLGTMGDIIPEWWAELSRNGLGKFPKAEPRIARNAPGLLMSRRGAGGWSARPSCKSWASQAASPNQALVIGMTSYRSFRAATCMRGVILGSLVSASKPTITDVPVFTPVSVTA